MKGDAFIFCFASNSLGDDGFPSLNVFKYDLCNTCINIFKFKGLNILSKWSDL